MHHGTEEVKIHLNLTKLDLLLTHYLINSKFEATDEMMNEMKDQFWEVNMDFKTRNSCNEKIHTIEFLLIRGQWISVGNEEEEGVHRV